MPAKRRPVNIDNDEVIDFSTVGSSNMMKTPVPTTLLKSVVDLSSSEPPSSEAVTTASAMDMRLNAYTHRHAPRRRIGFCCNIAPQPIAVSGASALPKSTTAPTAASPSSAVSHGSNTVSMSADSKEQLDAFWREEAARREEKSKQVSRQQYEQQLCDLFRGAAPLVTPDPKPSGNEDGSRDMVEHRAYSLLEQFFTDGVPDVEPWDHWALTMPRYSRSNIAVGISLDRIYHPTLPPTHYSQLYLHAPNSEETVFRLPKTRDELRAERQERMRKAKEERDRAKKAAKQNEQLTVVESTGGGPAKVSITVSAKDRLSNRNLRYNLFGDSVLNPLGTDNKVFSQYQERFLEHQRRNHKRHVEAIPHQIEKRKQDIKRHSEERPVFRAYHIYPIYSSAHLGKLRNFANDGLLRGFVLWICRCHAIIVLTGGEVAVRHLERWILEKMKWESAETKAVRLMTCPLPDPATFSFVRQKSRKRDRQQQGDDGSRGREENQLEGDRHGTDGERAHVYMNFVESVQEGESFMCNMPAEGPWRDLTHVWRAAVGAVVAVGGGNNTESQSTV